MRSDREEEECGQIHQTSCQTINRVFGLSHLGNYNFMLFFEFENQLDPQYIEKGSNEDRAYIEQRHLDGIVESVEGHIFS